MVYLLRTFSIVGLLFFSQNSYACDYSNGCSDGPGAGCRFAKYTAASGPNIMCLPDAQYEIECFDPGQVDPETGNDGWEAAGTCYIRYGSDLQPKTPSEPPRNPTNKCGSVINVDHLSVGEIVKLHGADDALYYFSDRVVGREKDYKFSLPLVDDAFLADIESIDVDVSWEGQTSQANYLAANLNTSSTYDFTWDGKDQSGNFIEGATLVNITATHNYVAGNDLDSLPHEYNVLLGAWKAKLVGLGGWTHPKNHFFDPVSRKLYTGTANVSTPEVILVNQVGAVYEKVGGINDVALGFDYYAIASIGVGEVYIFSKEGKHLETRSAVTGGLFYSFTYDVDGRLEQIVDSFGNTTQITRPTATTVLITTPSLKVTTIVLNAGGWAESITDPLGNVHNMTYTSGGLMTTFTNPNGKVSTFTYNAGGELIKDENNHGFSLAFELIEDLNQTAGFDKLIKITTAEGLLSEHSTSLSFDSSVISRVINPSGTESTYSDSAELGTDRREADGYYTRTADTFDDRFSPNSRIRRELLEITTGDKTNTISYNTTQTYDDLDILTLDSETQTTNLNYAPSSYVQTYDGALKKYTLTSPMGKISTTSINDFEQVTQTQYAGLTPKDYTYDSNGRLIKVEQGARVLNITYNSEFEIAHIENAAGKDMYFEYDDNGQLTGINNKIVEFKYDGNGNISGVKPPGRSFFDLVHDGIDSLTEFIFPSIGGAARKKIVYEYDNDRRIDKITRPNGDVIDYVYDSSKGYLKKIISPEGEYKRNHNSSTDQLKRIVAPSGVKTWFGYKADLLRTVNTNYDDKITANFFWHNNLKMAGKKLTLKPAGVFSRITYKYDEDELLRKVGDLVIERYPETGFVEKIKLNGTYEFVGHSSSFGELSRRALWTNGSLHFKETYVRDNLGRITERVETLLGNATPDTYNYYYDYIGKLKQVDKNGVELRKYLYDLNGNRTGIEEGGVVITAGAYDDEDRILTYGTNTYTHDDFGQITQKVDSATSTTTNFAHNSIGALTSVSISDGTTTDSITYINDGLGRRIQKLKNGVFTNRYIYDEGIRLEGESNEAGTELTHYVYGTKLNVPEYMIRNDVKYKIVSDYVGSVRMVINTDTKAITQQISYDSFGNVLSDTNPGFQPFYFAGGLYDTDTKLLRYGAREYDPEIGRWMSKDPIRFEGRDTNLYAYVGNDPINYADPRGTTQVDLDNAIKTVEKVFPDLKERATIGFDYLSEDTYGLTDPYFFEKNKISINKEQFEGCLNDDEKKVLLDTVFHEAIHSDKSTLRNIYEGAKEHYGDDSDHREVGERAGKFTEKYIGEFLGM